MPNTRRAAAAAAALALGACASTPRAVEPRPIRFACAGRDPAAFGARGLALLRQNNWTVLAADSAAGTVRGAKGPVYAGLGENLAVDGPYRLTATLAGGQAGVVVQEVAVRAHRAVPVANLDDRSVDADRRNFIGVLDGLRAFCGAPTSGRPNPYPQPAAPPPDR